jgi:hypothetical protein
MISEVFVTLFKRNKKKKNLLLWKSKIINFFIFSKSMMTSIKSVISLLKIQIKIILLKKMVVKIKEIY